MAETLPDALGQILGANSQQIFGLALILVVFGGLLAVYALWRSNTDQIAARRESDAMVGRREEAAARREERAINAAEKQAEATQKLIEALKEITAANRTQHEAVLTAIRDSTDSTKAKLEQIQVALQQLEKQHQAALQQLENLVKRALMATEKPEKPEKPEKTEKTEKQDKE